MGYTHYWSFKKSKSAKSRLTDSAIYNRALDEVRTFIIKANTDWKARHGQSIVSGVTPHCNYNHGSVSFNGAHGGLCEPFELPNSWKEVECDFFFCKTNYLDYDLLVKGALIILHTQLCGLVLVSSDGNVHDWMPALELVRRLMPGRWELPDAIKVLDEAR